MIEIDKREECGRKYQELLDSLPNITSEEFYEKDKTEDLCYEVKEGTVAEDIEDYLDEHSDIDFDNTEEIQDLIQRSKQIPVYTKERYKIPEGFILDHVKDYLSDNFCYDWYEQGDLPLNEDEIKQFENQINEKLKNWYISDKLVYTMDLSKEVEEMIRCQSE